MAATRQRAVCVHIPSTVGSSEYLIHLHEAANAVGSYATSVRTQGVTDRVRFGFTSARRAASSRARAAIQWGACMAGLDWEVRAHRQYAPRVSSWTLGHAVIFGFAFGAFAGLLTALAGL
jgi:hypothetical protein